MSDDFTFESNGIIRKTGMKTPTTRPLGHSSFPAVDLLSLDDAYEILKNPNRKQVRDIGPLKKNLNQGSLSSCNLYAAARMLIVTGYFAFGTVMDYAPEFNYHLITGGRDEGSLLPDGMNSLIRQGMPHRSYYPYQVCDQRPSPEAMNDASQNKLLADEVNQMPADSIEQHYRAMVSSVLRRQSLVTAVHVGRNWMEVDRRTGIVGLDLGPGNHAIAVTDCELNPRLNGSKPRSWAEFLLWHDGSWDESYGVAGGGFITIEHTRQPMQYHATYGGRAITRNRGQFAPAAA